MKVQDIKIKYEELDAWFDEFKVLFLIGELDDKESEVYGYVTVIVNVDRVDAEYYAGDVDFGIVHNQGWDIDNIYFGESEVDNYVIDRANEINDKQAVADFFGITVEELKSLESDLIEKAKGYVYGHIEDNFESFVDLVR